jgi:predicted enzyme related to lactoylglutathione lyase
MSSPSKPRSSNPDAAAVLFTIDLARIAQFYETVAGLRVAGAEDDHVVLENGSFRLIIHQIPAQYAKHIRIDDPPAVREAGAIKLSFPVVSIADAREAAARLGGSVYPAGRESSYDSATVCDGWDPDGNVFQLSQPKTAASS